MAEQDLDVFVDAKIAVVHVEMAVDEPWCYVATLGVDHGCVGAARVFDVAHRGDSIAGDRDPAVIDLPGQDVDDPAAEHNGLSRRVAESYVN